MFKFLKEKLKQGIKNFSSKVEEEGATEEEIIEKPIEEKKGILSKIKEKFAKKEIIPEGAVEQKIKIKDEALVYQKKEEIRLETEELHEKEERIVEEIQKKEIPKIQELQERKEKKKEIDKIEKELEPGVAEVQKKGIFQTIRERITTKKISKEQFEKIFWDLEVALLENNVALEVIEKIKDDLSQDIVEKPLPRGKIEDAVTSTLKTSIEGLLNMDSFDILEKIKTKKPYIICFVGINGSGKTTTIAKLARLLLDNKLSVVLAAADTFRAASIEQLQLHADNLKVKLIKHNYGSDPAAVAFDAVKYANSKNIDVVLIDTAGRIHSNINLTDEMKKIVRIAKPDLKVFVGEAITGNDCVEQAKKFNEAIGIDGIILSKADVDEKGGAAISVSYVTQKPILFIGTGQEYQDLKVFNSSLVLDNLGIT
jgi:fused signal recognition particle receptor